MKIKIQKLRCAASIGVYDWELEAKRVLFVSLEIEFDFNEKLAADDIHGAIDYDKIEMLIINFAASRHFNLIENFVHHLGQEIMKNKLIKSLSLDVTKPGVLTHSEAVSICEEFRLS